MGAYIISYFLFALYIFIIYNLQIKVRAINNLTNLGNIYLLNIYIKDTNITKAKVTWFIK